ncbi:S-adenosyl-L-methionine-dependent methyltransferase [Dipodascopsis uninucleata]
MSTMQNVDPKDLMQNNADESEIEDFEDLIQENELESASDWTADDETRPVCLFCEITFENAEEVWEHCTSDHDFDYNRLRKGLGLDFFGKLKLVNYIRAQVKQGKKPELNTPGLFLEDSQYLKPTLQDDALLFGIQDEESDEDEVDPDTAYEMEQLRVEAKERAEKIKVLQGKLKDLQLQFDEYKDIVSTVINHKTIASSSDDSDSEVEPNTTDKVSRSRSQRSGHAKRRAVKDDNNDDHYFQSYAYNEIHETMLKDKIRTESYRDFIYENKDIFKDKIVLDVGCGTGILSMFAAKAGAKKVFAVDNSDIIERAIANVVENNLDNVIQCFRGRIEEIRLPVEKVDIIVSEWMGYALLYEAMLDSVLVARDKYLAPDGLMVPSECRLMVAGIRDPEYINDRVNFWNDIYGFKMTAMKPSIYKDVLVEDLKPSQLLHSEPIAFQKFPLHTVTVPELEFKSELSLPTNPTDKSVNATAVDGNLDGLLIYFDTYFTRSRDEIIPEDARAESFRTIGGSLGFTTGPWGPKPTHWHSGVLLFNKTFKFDDTSRLTGTIEFAKDKNNNRELVIGVELQSSLSKLGQSYLMR